MSKGKKINLVISIVIAIILWAYVITVENPTVTQKFDNIEVQILNTESLIQRNLIVLTDEAPTVTVMVEGKRADVSKIKAEDIIATADVYGYSAGENHVPVTVEVPGNVDVAEVKSARVSIVIDELISIAHEIEVEPMGQTAKGTELTAIDITPGEVMVTGARSLVSKVVAVKTNLIAANFNGEDERKIATEIYPADAEGYVVENVSLSSKTADITARLLKTKEVSLNLQVTGNVASKYTVSDKTYPETIVIKGTKADLKEIESLDALPIDISEITSTSKIPIEIQLPEGIMLSDKSKDNYLYIVINSVVAKDFEYQSSAIEFSNLSEGLGAYVMDNSIKVTAKGSEGAINSLVSTDILLHVDLTDLGEGTHNVSLTADSAKELSEILVEPESVQVVIFNEL